MTLLRGLSCSYHLHGFKARPERLLTFIDTKVLRPYCPRLCNFSAWARTGRRREALVTAASMACVITPVF